MPIAAISFTVKPVLVMASAAVPNCVLHISVASCSTQPDCGNICVNSFCAAETMFPCLLKIIERELVVPWSNDKIYCCLLYTSDAADERSSVDLGGRRIIK